MLSLFANKSYLYIMLLCATFYAVVFPFQDYLADMLKHKYGYGEIAAGDFTSLIPWGAAVFTIIFGAFVDKKGLRATLMIGGSILLVVSHLGFALTYITPWLLVPMFGIAFSLVPSAMWPAVALIVEEKRLGTAYGLMTWMQNLWWWAMALIAGWVLDKSNPEVTVETLQAGTGVYDYTVTMLTFAGFRTLRRLLRLQSQDGGSRPRLARPRAAERRSGGPQRSAVGRLVVIGIELVTGFVVNASNT